MARVNSAILMRYCYTNEYTLGLLFVGQEMFHIIERPWLNNAKNASCIPKGTYPLTFLKKSGSGKYTNVYWVRNVPGRSGILIHNGNLVEHSLGCMIIGMRKGTIKGETAVLNSVTAKNKLAKHKIDQLIIAGDY